MDVLVILDKSLEIRKNVYNDIPIVKQWQGSERLLNKLGTC